MSKVNDKFNELKHKLKAQNGKAAEQIRLRRQSRLNAVKSPMGSPPRPA